MEAEDGSEFEDSEASPEITRVNAHQIATELDLYKFIPRWHACLVSTSGQVAACNNIIQPTKDEAEEHAWEMLERVLAANDQDFERYEWTVDHIVLQGGN